MKQLVAALIVLLSATSAFAQFDFPNSPTANQIVSGPAGQALKWDGTKWVAQFGPVAGPWLPLAGGTMTGPINNVTALGIGAAAPTTAGIMEQATANGNFQAAISVANNSNATGASAGITFQNDRGAASGAWLAYASSTYTGQGPAIPADSFQVSENGTGGMVIDTNYTITPGPPIAFWSGPSEAAIINQNGLVLPNIASTSLYFGSATAPAGSLTAVGSPNINVAAGAHYNGTTWIADNATPLIMSGFSGGWQFTEDTGQTVGATYTPTKIFGINTGGASAQINVNGGAGLGAQNLSTGNNAAGQVTAQSNSHSTTLLQYGPGYNANPFFPPNAAAIETDSPNALYFGSYVNSTNLDFNITGSIFGQFHNGPNQLQGLVLPGYAAGIWNNPIASLGIGNAYMQAQNWANLNISGATYWNGGTWIADGGAGSGAVLFSMGPTCFTMYNAGGMGAGTSVPWTSIGQWCGSGQDVGHLENIQDAPSPRVSSGVLVKGSKDTFGWIKDVKGAETTLTFQEDYEGESNCTLTSAGQPMLWFTANQTIKEVTFACVIPWTGEPCADGAIVEYHCFGQGDETSTTHSRRIYRDGNGRGTSPLALPVTHQ